MANSATGQKVFGSGYFYGMPTTANPTPTQFGATQDISLDFKRDLKYLHGVNQIAIEVASGKLTVSGKVGMATLNGRLVNDLLLGTTLASGQTSWIPKELGTVAAGTVTVANSATWVLDLGVTYKSTNLPLTRVASTPALGQYTVAAGVYTFNTSDNGNAVFISYTFTTASTGQSITITNQAMGKTGNFQAVLAMLYGTEKTVIQLNNVMAGGLNIATKLDDFTMPGFDYGCGTDSTDTLGTFSFAEVN